MRFRSKRMMEYEHFYDEEEMLRFINYLLYDTDLSIDHIRDRFANEFGEENSHILEEVLNEQ